MIARLTGRCVGTDAETLILDVGGVGYLVRATAGVLREASRADEPLTIHVHTSVREDAIQLFGFATRAEQVVFERLVQLQGVGPKVAIGVLDVLSPHDIRRATDMDDVKLLQSVPGVGPKVARRMVTELKDKLDDIAPVATRAGSTTFGASVEDGGGIAAGAFYEAREALVGLGMQLSEAESLLAGTSAEADATELVREALRTRAVRA